MYIDRLLMCIALDVSADLHDLSRCPVGLVSAGVKSILDIGRYERITSISVSKVARLIMLFAGHWSI